jgi:predicted nucleic-acid-binding protein
MTPETLDANTLVRFLTRDDPVKAAAVRSLLQRAARGEIALRLSAFAFGEVVFVLEKVYHWSKAEIASRAGALLALAGLDVEEAPTLQDALAMYAGLNIDFVDAFQGAWALANGCPVIYSYDRDLDRMPGISRREP